MSFTGDSQTDETMLNAHIGNMDAQVYQSNGATQTFKPSATVIKQASADDAYANEKITIIIPKAK
jgi:hypothetical protein